MLDHDDSKFDVDDQFGEDDILSSDRQEEIDDAHVDDGLALRMEEAFRRLQKRATSAKREGRGILLFGPSGTGKSHALKRLTLSDDFVRRETPQGLVCPLLEVTAPTPCTLKTLGREIYLQLTGADMRNGIEEHGIWSRVRAHLAAQKVKYLFIDEVQHVLIGRNQEEHRKVAETFKMTMQMRNWPVYLVLAGTPDALTFVEKHAQLRRRVRKIEITPVPPGIAGDKAILRHVEILIKKLGVTIDFELEPMAPRLHIASAGYLGLCSQLVKDATELALDAGETTVGVEDLAQAYVDLYSTNGREIDVEKNPFLCSDLSFAMRVKPEDYSRSTLVSGTKNPCGKPGSKK